MKTVTRKSKKKGKEAIENAEVYEREDENISDDEQVNTVGNMDKYAFFDPDRHDSFKN